VYKNKKMPGRLGGKTVTVQNLKLYAIDVRFASQRCSTQHVLQVSVRRTPLSPLHAHTFMHTRRRAHAHTHARTARTHASTHSPTSPAHSLTHSPHCAVGAHAHTPPTVTQSNRAFPQVQRNLLFVEGAIPGNKGNYVKVGSWRGRHHEHVCRPRAFVLAEKVVPCRCSRMRTHGLGPSHHLDRTHLCASNTPCAPRFYTPPPPPPSPSPPNSPPLPRAQVSDAKKKPLVEGLPIPTAVLDATLEREWRPPSALASHHHHHEE
jgi:hypothetical protein